MGQLSTELSLCINQYGACTGPEIIAPEEQWAWGELLAALSLLYRILKFVAVIPDTEVSDYHHPSSPSHPEWAIHDAKKARCR